MNTVKLFKLFFITYLLLTGCTKKATIADNQDTDSKILNIKNYFSDARVEVINDTLIVCHPEKSNFNLILEKIEYSVFNQEKINYEVKYEFNRNKDILLIKSNKVFEKVKLVISYNGIVVREWFQ